MIKNGENFMYVHDHVEDRVRQTPLAPPFDKLAEYFLEKKNPAREGEKGPASPRRSRRHSP